MKVISSRFLSRKELRNKIVRDIIIAILFIFIVSLIYIQIKSPIPVKFIFRSLFQDVKNNVVEEYSKIYYPTYYFSVQMTPIFDLISKAPEAYKVLITNFFPRHQFIEKAILQFGNSYMSITKENDTYKVMGHISRNSHINNNNKKYPYPIPFEQLNIDSFYVQNNRPYIHLVYIANENVGFEYISQFNLDFSNINLTNLTDVYAYLITGNSKVTFPISKLSTNESPETYIEIAKMITEQYNYNTEDIVKISYNNKYYWGYRGTFSVGNNVNQVGVIIPEKALINKIQIPVILFIIVFFITLIAIIIIIAAHYIRIIEDLKVNQMNIKKIIAQGESTLIEFKSTLRYDYNTEKINKALEEVIMKSIAAFANTEGGRLFIGIGNEGEILGIENDYNTLKQPNRDFFELHLRTIVETYYGNAFSAECIRIDFVEEDGKDVCIVYINKSREPIYTKVTSKQGVKEEKFFIRVGNSSREIANTSEIIAYINKHFKRYKI